MVDQLPISSITVPGARMRPLGDVSALAESIAQNGLINPITVARDGTLISGLHRLEACKLLGWTEIPANVTDLEGMRAELAEIDENFVRSDLTILQKADHLARRVEILETLGMRAPSHRAKKGDTVSPFTTTADMASEMGMSKRTAQRLLQIAKINPRVKAAITDTWLANSTSNLLLVASKAYPVQMVTAMHLLAQAHKEEFERVLQNAERSDREEYRDLLGQQIRAITHLAVVQTAHIVADSCHRAGGVDEFIKLRERYVAEAPDSEEYPIWHRPPPTHVLVGCLRYAEEGIHNQAVAARLITEMDTLDEGEDDWSHHTEEERALYDRLTAA